MKVESVTENWPQEAHDDSARQKFTEPLQQSIRELEGRISAEIGMAWSRSRRVFGEELNQSMRRLRQCGSTEEVATWLVDSSTPDYCGGAALFEVAGAELRGVRARGFGAAEKVSELAVPLEQAPALAQAARERDTVVAIGSPAEVSPAIVEALGQAEGGKVYLFPVVIQDKAAAILYATAENGQAVDTAALELLAHWSAIAAQLLAPEERVVTRPASELVSIQAAARPAAGDPQRESLEARARWFARVEAARMRLFHREALERGRAERNIYSALKEQIDTARRLYSQDFLAVSPAMADYLDKELIGLAHDDANLLGPEYPGSLV